MSVRVCALHKLGKQPKVATFPELSRRGLEITSRIFFVFSLSLKLKPKSYIFIETKNNYK